MACRLANLEVISLLLASGADIEARDKVSRVFDLGCRLLSDCDETGYTPLHMASLLANLEVISLLLASEADIETRNQASCKSVILVVSVMPHFLFRMEAHHSKTLV
jgi:ankyrin repeat protein